MHPQLRRYLEFAFGRSVRMDFLRALDDAQENERALREALPQLYLSFAP